MFMNPLAKQMLVDWADEVAFYVAAFRSSAGPDIAAADHRALIEELTAGNPDFSTIWQRQDVRVRSETLKHFAHPDLGRFSLNATSFLLAEHPSLRISLYLPADVQSEVTFRAALEQSAA
jgi:hypothetical protein